MSKRLCEHKKQLSEIEKYSSETSELIFFVKLGENMSSQSLYFRDGEESSESMLPQDISSLKNILEEGNYLCCIYVIWFIFEINYIFVRILDIPI